MKSHVHLLLLHEVQYITILSGTLKLAVKRWIEGLLSVDMGGISFLMYLFLLYFKLRDCRASLAMTGYFCFFEFQIKKGQNPFLQF